MSEISERKIQSANQSFERGEALPSLLLLKIGFLNLAQLLGSTDGMSVAQSPQVHAALCCQMLTELLRKSPAYVFCSNNLVHSMLLGFFILFCFYRNVQVLLDSFELLPVGDLSPRLGPENRS